MQRRHEAHVVIAGLLGMKPGTQLQQRSHAALALHPAPCRPNRACRNLQKRTFPCSVFSYQTKRLTRLDSEVHAVQRNVGSMELPACHQFP